MPTRIVAGAGSLATTGVLARELKMARVLVVSDPVISAQPFHAQALAALADGGIAATVTTSIIGDQVPQAFLNDRMAFMKHDFSKR